MKASLRLSLGRALAIVLLGSALGLSFNAISSKGIPIIAPPKAAPRPEEFIPLDEAQKLWNAGAVLFLDARAPEDYAAGHIAKALNLPADAFDAHFTQIAPTLIPEMPILIYCDGEECELSHRLKDRLRELGFANARILRNGWTAWRTAGLLTEKGARP